MDHYTGIRPDEIKGISGKYGAVMLIMLLNATLFQFVLNVLVVMALNFSPDAPALLDPHTDSGYLLIMAFNEVVSYALPLASFAYIFKKELIYKPVRPDEIIPAPDYERIYGTTLILFFTSGAVSTVCSIVTRFISAFFAGLFGLPETKAAFSSLMPMNLFTYTVFMVCVCVVAPVCEEILYRYILLKPLRKYSDTAAAVITSFLFALSHFNFDQFLYAFGLGIIFSVIAIRTDSVVPAIIVHVINNIIAGVMNYAPETFGDETVDAVFAALRDAAPSISLIMLFISLIAAVVALFLKMLRLKNNCNIPVGEQFRLLLGKPLTVIAAVLCLAYTAYKLIFPL